MNQAKRITTQEEIEIAKKQVADGMSFTEMAEYWGYSCTQGVKCRLESLGLIKTNHFAKDEECNTEILRLYANGYYRSDIAAELGISKHRVDSVIFNDNRDCYRHISIPSKRRMKPMPVEVVINGIKKVMYDYTPIYQRVWDNGGTNFIKFVRKEEA